MRFKPIKSDVTVGAISVEHWSKDSTGKPIFLGEIRRDYQLTILDNATEQDQSPILTRTDIPKSEELHMVPGKQACMRVATFDADQNDSVSLFWDKGTPGASFSITPGRFEQGEFCWTPDTGYIRTTPYLLTITATDHACPVHISTQHTYKIFVDTVSVPLFDMPYTMCLNSTFSPINKTLYFKNKPAYTWYFGDGDSSTSENPTHSYKKPGPYTVTLQVQDSGHAVQQLSKKLVVMPGLLAAILHTNGTACTKANEYAFSAFIQNAEGPVKYRWYFGNGDSSTLAKDSVVYLHKGLYPISLLAEDSIGCRAYVTDTITVGNAYFDVNGDSIQCLTGNQFIFNHVPSMKASYWSFGDGATASNTFTEKHSYKDTGTYKVRLVTVTQNNCYDTFYRYVHVQDIKASFRNDSPACVGRPVAFAHIATNSASTQYEWAFDQDTVRTPNATHTFISSGKHHVRLMVFNPNGCMDIVNKDITVYEQPATDITGPDTIYAGDTTTYQAITQTGNTYKWKANGAFPVIIDSTVNGSISIRFDSTGTAALQLKAQNNDGCEGSSEKSITILDRNSGIEKLQGWHSLGLYPVPATDKAYLQVEATIMQNLSISILSLNGKTLSMWQVHLAKGRQTQVLDLSGLAPGVYVLQLRTDKGYEHIKLIKQ